MADGSDDGRGLRGALSIAALAVAALVVAAALVLVYARMEVLDPERFADRAADSVSASAVRSAIAEGITRDVIERALPDALVARPVVESIVADLVGSDAFRPVVRTAARETYRVVADGEGGEVVLVLTDAAILAVEALRQLSPEAAARVPPEAEQAVVELGQRDWTSDAVGNASTLRALAWPAAVLALALLAAGVATAPDRRRGAADAGVAVAAGAALTLATTALGGWEVRARAPEDRADAAAAVWSAYTDDLGTWALWALAAGIALWAIARGLLEVDRLADVGRRAVAWTFATPDDRREAAARGAILVGVGGVLALVHDRFLEFALLVGAALLVARGVGLLVRALAPRRLAAQRHDPPPARQALRAPLIAAVGVALVVGGAAAVVVAARGGDDVPAGTAGCNGAPALCERPVTEVVFPATHNSMSAADEGWFSAEHTGGIGAQLDSGIRGLLIDTWYGRPGSRGVATDFAASGVDRDDLVREYGPDAVAAVERVRGRLGFGRRNGRPADVYLCHIACEAGATRLEDVLVTVRRFLERERGAVLVIVVQDQVAPADVRRAFVRSGLRRYVLEERPAERWPTLARMIRTDQRVIVMNENRTDPDIPWMLPAFEVMEETPYDAATIGQLSCRPNRGGTRKPFFQLNHWVNDVPRSPRTAARINARDFLVDRARRCARERGSLPNLLAVNFYEEGDVTGAADRLNGLEAER